MIDLARVPDAGSEIHHPLQAMPDGLDTGLAVDFARMYGPDAFCKPLVRDVENGSAPPKGGVGSIHARKDDYPLREFFVATIFQLYYIAIVFCKILVTCVTLLNVKQ